MQIVHVIGDATAPKARGPKIIAHVVNTHGRWGAGFTGALSRKWYRPELLYREWHKKPLPGHDRCELGGLQVVQVEDSIWVANMVAQVGTGELNGPPIRYEALRICLNKLAIVAASKDASVHMPRIGCALAGGRWTIVGPMIEKSLCDMGIGVHVYDLPGASFNP